jgi:hypothetical protein
MRFDLNWTQRGLLVFAGLFCLLLAFGSMTDTGGDRTLGTAQFLIACVLFVGAASSRKESKDGR